MIRKAAALPVIHGKACQVGGQHVRRKLDALKREPNRPAQRHRQRGFAHAGHVVQQHMAARQHRRQDLFDDRPLADDDLFRFPDHIFKLRTHDAPPKQ